MRSTRYDPLDTPIKLHLEFKQITVGEISSVLRQWQAILRSAWREAYELQFSGSVPTARIIAVSVSTEHSLDILSDIAIPALHLSVATIGPIKDWRTVTRSAYGYLNSVWSQKAEEEYGAPSQTMRMRGGDVPELDIPVDALRDSKTADRIETLWRIANSGEIDITVEAID